jgi:hypothetical protein
MDYRETHRIMKKLWKESEGLLPTNINHFLFEFAGDVVEDTFCVHEGKLSEILHRMVDEYVESVKEDLGNDPEFKED